jgi:hypothetical protein
MTHDIFISHSSHDREVAEAACIALEQRGFRCWIAPRDILPGHDYGEAIVDAIRGSRLFLLIFSAATAASPQVKREVERAASQSLPILPFRIADVQPSKSLEYFISSAHWLDALTPPIAPHLDYLGDTVAQLLDGAGPGPLMPTLPPRPLPRRRSYGWMPIAATAGAGVVAIAIAAAWVARPSAPPAPSPPEPKAAALKQGAVPDVSRSIFTRRAVPVRGDKPLRLRAGPSAASAQVAVIGTDEVFRVAPRQGDWWPAQLANGSQGYVMARWVNVLDAGGR